MSKIPSEVIDIPAIDVEKTSVEIRKSLIVPDVTNALIGKLPVIKSAEDKQKRFEELQLIKGEIKRLDTDRKGFTDPLRAIFEKIKARYDETINPLKLAEEVYKKSILAWDEAEAKRIEDENRKARLKAEEDARKEEARLRKIREDQERVQREKEEEARKEAERLEKIAQNARSEKARKAAEEAAAKARDDEAKAKAKADERAAQAQEISVAPVTAPTIQPQKTAGQSYRKKWFGEVTDASLVPRNYLEINQKKIDASIHAMDGDIVIPGVTNKFEKIMSAGSK
jgi:hypothetical protein